MVADIRDFEDSELVESTCYLLKNAKIELMQLCIYARSNTFDLLLELDDPFTDKKLPEVDAKYKSGRHLLGSCGSKSQSSLPKKELPEMIEQQAASNMG
jgi:hypothetical protein